MKILKKNRGFRALLRVVLVFMNFIIGDFTAKTIRGFRASDLTKVTNLFAFSIASLNSLIKLFSQNINFTFDVNILQICATEVCNSPKTTLLNIVASSTISEFPEVCVFRDTLPALERASRGYSLTFTCH